MQTTTQKLEANYDHQKHEKKCWDFWMQGAWFEASLTSQKPTYCVLIPPPNVTDRLHMGHGLNNTIQDILVRWKRMQGFNCLWLPGTDHAGISTQMMVEKSLSKEGISRKQLGREKFFDVCVNWKDKNGSMIIDQLKRLGSSCDWSRLSYTMDPKLSRAVREIFVKLYKDGLIYRGERLVNWDCQLETAVSDDEVVNEEVNDHLWHIRYPLADAKGDDEYVVVATTRPETMFGDTAVAVHPDDERYKSWIGRFINLPFMDKKIPIIADTHVKMDFGTGCVKITPAHDYNDFEMGKRHGLPFIDIMTNDGKLNQLCPAPFAGMDRVAARQAVIRALKEQGFFEKNTPYRHTVPLSERSKTVIEPRLSKQWYVKMQSLAQPALQYAKRDELRFYPDTWKKTYFHWLENVQDWCISRQLWWGHRIPIWYCQDCSTPNTGIQDPTHCESCGSHKLTQDEDVFDTWFSSWLWPISPFGWPDESEELKKFFPSQVLVTGPDIIYLWVARMIMVSHYTQGQLAFKDVYFNSLICDKNGQKFSKTLGNGIDPIDVIDKHGADAVRFTCVSLAPLGGRVRMDVSDFENGTRFINKIWNAARFLTDKIPSQYALKAFDKKQLDLPGKWLVNEFKISSEKINTHLQNYQINEACELLFHFIWHHFCDWGIEASKDKLGDPKHPEFDNTLSCLMYVFEGCLRLAAPFMPFVTEEIWQKLPKHPQWTDRPESLVIASYPGVDLIPGFKEEAEQWNLVREMISGVRSLRTQATIPPKEKVRVVLMCQEPMRVLVTECRDWISRLAGVSELLCGPQEVKPENSLVSAGKSWALYVPVGDFLDIEKEKKRLHSEILRIEKIISGLENKLKDPKFVEKAPKDVVEQAQNQLLNMSNQNKVLKDNLTSLS